MVVRGTVLLLGLIVLLSHAAIAADGPAKQLHAFFAAEWDWTMQQNPTWASSLGDRRWNTQWEDLSITAIEARQEHRKAALRQLKAIDRAALGTPDQLSYDLFADHLKRDIEEFDFAWHLLPLNQRGGIQTEDELAARLRFETVQDYQDYVARLRALPTYVDQTIALMRDGIRRKMVHPRIIMQRVPAQIAVQVVDDATRSPFYRPFTRFPSQIPAEAQQRLSSSAADAIREDVVPAYRRFAAFFNDEYLPACLENPGIWQLPRGAEMYAFFARRFTTTELTPDEIHNIGLAEVARIGGEMDKIIAEVNFTGTREQFFSHLRTDPRFFHKTGDELLAATRALCKTIDPRLVQVFGVIPRIPYGVEPIPEAIAPDTTTAYYQGPAADGSRAGTYYVNLYRPDTRPKWEMLALTLHEAVPGHHFQIARAMELGDVPNFRRHADYTAFVEGWGLYSESLGQDMGLYSDPYDRFGQLTYEMWRAVRLVVDTGIHHKRWSRQQAIDYFKSNAPKSELDITNEIDRYIAWPGQALAYKIGQIQISKLRARAQTALGDKFDLKAFHDVVLGQGAVPLPVLERAVDQWIDDRLQQKTR